MADGYFDLGNGILSPLTQTMIDDCVIPRVPVWDPQLLELKTSDGRYVMQGLPIICADGLIPYGSFSDLGTKAEPPTEPR